MSWLYSRALVEGCLRHSSLAYEQDAPLRLTPSVSAYLSNDKTQDNLNIPSPYGMISEPLTERNGQDVLMWYLEASLAKPSLQPLTDTTQQLICGQKCSELLGKAVLELSLQKTYPEKQLKKLETTCVVWVSTPKHLPLARKTWVQTTHGNDIGYLHTPTTQGNYCAASMQKHPSARAYKKVFGKVSPENHEYLMGWPIGWTDLEQPETDKSLS